MVADWRCGDCVAHNSSGVERTWGLLKRWLFSIAVLWGCLLVFALLCIGLGAWQMKMAAETIRKDEVSVADAKAFTHEVAVANVLFKVARYNPGVQMLRVIPDISWAPQALIAGSRVVSEVHSILENGGVEILTTALSGELTPEAGTIDVKAAVGVAENAQRIGGRVLRLRSAVADLDGLKVPGVADSRIEAAVTKATGYLELAESAVAAMKQLPQLIGSETPVRYFVGITNEAELRGIQGIIGEYAIVEIDKGKISVSRTGSNTELVDPDALPPELVGEYSEIFGETNTEWQNMNLSPFLDPAALQITSAWNLQTGESLDGVVLLDTVALAKWAIPKVGSVQSAQGRVLTTWEALADYLSNGIYFEFPTDQFARKSFQSELAGQLIGAITGSSLDIRQTTQSLAKPMAEGRLVAWLNGAKGGEFNTTMLARSTSSFPDDFFVGFNNLTGNKMDFYLGVEASIHSCESVELKFSSSAKLNIDYPDYLTRRLDSDAQSSVGSYLEVNVVLPAGNSVIKVMELGEDVAFDVYPISGNRTLVRTWIEVLASTMRDLTFSFVPQSGRCSGRIDVSPLRQDVGWGYP